MAAVQLTAVWPAVRRPGASGQPKWCDLRTGGRAAHGSIMLVEAIGPPISSLAEASFLRQPARWLCSRDCSRAVLVCTASTGW